MSKIIKSNLVKKGNLIDNYLVNFPQFINKEKNSIYKLVVGQNLTCFTVKFENNISPIKIPLLPFKEDQECYIFWGDGEKSKSDEPNFLEHTYSKRGIYDITIIGNTSNFFSTFHQYYNNLTPEEQSKVRTFRSVLTDIKKLSDNLTNLSAAFFHYKLH